MAINNNENNKNMGRKKHTNKKKQKLNSRANK